MAKATYYSNGSVINYKNGGSEPIKYGDVVPLTDCIGVAVADIQPGDTGALRMDGVFAIPAAAEAFTPGQTLYWDTANSVVTATSENNTAVGYAAEEKAANAPAALVKIGGR